MTKLRKKLINNKIKSSLKIKIKKLMVRIRTVAFLVLPELVEFHGTVQSHYETLEENWLILITEN